MEEQEEEVDPEYLRGFNEGYMLAQHNPELAQTLASIDSDFIRLAGFKAGQEQFHVEQVHTQEKEKGKPQEQIASDLFDQLYRQQTQVDDLNQKLIPPTAFQQKLEETDDLFAQLKKKQEQHNKSLDIEP